MKKRLLIGALALGLITPVAFAQTVIQNQVSGNEVWPAAQSPGGSSEWLNINTVSGRTANVVGTISGSAVIPTLLSDGGNWLITAQPSAATITLPASPVPRGAIVGICNTTASAWATNVVTVAGNTGQTSPVGATATITTLAAGSCARYQFNLSNMAWYRVQ